MPRIKKSTADSLTTTAKTEATKKKTTVKSGSRKSVVGKQTAGLFVPVYNLVGTSSGNMPLPKEVFGAKVNQSLLSQALRVYLNNQKGHWSNTKTRGEVSGTTKKVFKQKHTGNARHGSKKAPIFIGGGIALGPKSRKVLLELPKKMKKAALISALSQRTSQETVFGITDLEKVSGKTKQMANLMEKLDKKSTLVVAEKPMELVKRAVQNLPRVDFIEIGQINVFEVINHQSILLTKEAVEKLQEKLGKNKDTKEER